MSVKTASYRPKVTWDTLTGKPAAYPPSAHTHLWADITDRPTIPAATPLSDAAPAALGATASAGSATSAARGDHVHPLPAGRLQLVGNVTVSETTLVSLAVGMKRMTVPLTGITTADMGKLVVMPNGTSTAGCEVQNAYPASANNVSIGYYTPSLGIATTYTIPVSIYRVT